MTPLPSHIEQRFFDTLKGDIPILEFEQWLYQDDELESLLNADDYLELISLNFKSAGAKYDLWKILEQHVDLGKYETYKLLEALEEAKRRTPQLPYLLGSFYDLYCHGYSFLEDLGMSFGLRIQVPVVDDHVVEEEWDELSADEQERILQSFYPRLDECLDQAIEWLHAGQVVLTGDTNELGHHEYVDLRTTEQRKSKLWVRPSDAPQASATVSKDQPNDNTSRAAWWQFWK